MRALCLPAVMAGIVNAQSSALLFEDVSLFFQKVGETTPPDEKRLLALDGGQRVMLLDQKEAETLTVRFGGGSAPAGSVKMELPGKWKDIPAIRSQSQKPVEMVGTK